MPQTNIRGRQVLDGSIQRADLDITTVGQAVTAKLIQGTGITLSSTGADAGTGDVTISASGGGTDPGAVQKTGGTMTGTLEIDDPGGGGGAVLQVFDATYSRYVRLVAQGVIYLNSGGSQTVIGGDGSSNLSIGFGAGIVLASGYPATTKIGVDTTTGDVIATALYGPNAGKSLNLTSGFTVGSGGLNGYYATTFNETENPLSENGVWTQGGVVGLDWTNVRATPGFAFGTIPGNGTGNAVYADSTAVLTGNWGPDQTVQATVRVISATSTVNVFEEVSLRLRTSVTAHSITGYEILISVSTEPTAGNYVQIIRWNGSLAGFTELDGRSYHAVNNDIFKATIVGNLISVYLNGTFLFSATDSTYTSGSPGIGFFLQNATGLNANYGFSAFTATDGRGPISGGGSGDMLKSVYDTNNNGAVDTCDSLLWTRLTGTPVALDTLSAPTDISTLNASTTAHGLLRKLDNTATHYLDGTGAWTTPAGGGGGTQGPAGANAYTTTTANFTVPNVGSTTTVTVADASWVVVGQMVWVDTAAGGVGQGGVMQVTAKAGNTLTLLTTTAPGITYPYDIALFAAGKPAASALLMRFLFNRSISCGTNLTGSAATVGTAATASTVFALAKNGSSIGSLTFGAGGTTGTFSVASPQSFVSGDVVTVTAPSSQDATLSDLSVTLTGVRS